MHRTRNIARAAAAILVPLLAACGGDTATSLGTQATVSSVILNDNPSSTSSSGTGGSNSSSYTGTLSGDVQAQISMDGRTWYSLGQPANVSVALQSTTSATQLTANASVHVGTYAYARLVFSDGAQATATGTVGGTSYAGTVVSLGSGQVVIEKQIQPVHVDAGSSVSVVWDLNSELWLTGTAAQSRTTTAAAVQTAAYAAITGT